jgi:hypothetical protein
MEKVSFEPSVKFKLLTLIEVLFKKEYFGFIESALEYVDKLESFALNIPQERRRLCKNPRYGKWYCKYNANKKTTWFFTFDTDGEYYLIRNVLNNHTSEYPTYIQGEN